ncbi:hypothetical protein OH784_18090 [Ectobacillus funiculus]|uniref:hypothetical protein n=1 Tax=Ectobacillus funiculus TaxID=137993 RepID=UPI00397B5F90
MIWINNEVLYAIIYVVTMGLRCLEVGRLEKLEKVPSYHPLYDILQCDLRIIMLQPSYVEV